MSASLNVRFAPIAAVVADKVDRIARLAFLSPRCSIEAS
jgi:hypothetical protein